MILLTYPNDDTQANEIVERLAALSLAHRVESTAEGVLTLTQGKASFVGLEAIMAYLDKLDGERKQWYYCNC